MKTFKYEELNDKEKAKARDYYIANLMDDYWLEDSVQIFKEELENLGFDEVNIRYSGFASQGDGASFVGSIIITDYLENCCSDETRKQFAELLEIKDELNTIEIYHSNNYYVHHNTMYSLSWDLENTNINVKYWKLLSDISLHCLEFSKEKALQFYRTIEQEYYEQMLDERIDEFFIEYGFDFVLKNREIGVIFL